MPGNERLNKPSRETNVGKQNVGGKEETEHSSPEQRSHPVSADNRRTGSRRTEEATDSNDSAMDVALGTEREAWDRRRRPRRDDAA